MTAGRDRGTALAMTIATTSLFVAAYATLRSGTGTPVAPADPDLAATDRELADLRFRLSALEKRLENQPLGTREAVIAHVPSTTAARPEHTAPGGPTAEKVGGRQTEPDPRVSALAQQLSGGDMAERDRVWQQLRELGGVEEAVRWCEQMAKAQPANADAQTDLGVAFVNLMLQATTEEQRIELGKRIEAQFDKALALQPDHWEARFRRAVGLSYGDQMSGRRTEAITEFERLVTQQAALTPRPGHAETYVYLGRLYAQRGEHDKAREIWQRGSARHPHDEQLQRLTWQ